MTDNDRTDRLERREAALERQIAKRKMSSSERQAFKLSGVMPQRREDDPAEGDDYTVT